VPSALEDNVAWKGRPVKDRGPKSGEGIRTLERNDVWTVFIAMVDMKVTATWFCFHGECGFPASGGVGEGEKVSTQKTS